LLFDIAKSIRLPTPSTIAIILEVPTPLSKQVVLARIEFRKKFLSIEVSEGTNLMRALLANGRPVGSSCGGDGVCNKCLIRVTAGAENLSPIGVAENRWRQAHPVPENMRMSCQTLVLGSIEVDADYW
jgi:2Fe-2S ferredoxin